MKILQPSIDGILAQLTMAMNSHLYSDTEDGCGSGCCLTTSIKGKEGVYNEMKAYLENITEVCDAFNDDS